MAVRCWGEGQQHAASYELPKGFIGAVARDEQFQAAGQRVSGGPGPGIRMQTGQPSWPLGMVGERCGSLSRIAPPPVQSMRSAHMTQRPWRARLVTGLSIAQLGLRL